MVTLYNLMTQQLSKQDHYDFGLRAIKSVLNCAGAIRRSEGSSEQGANRDKEREKEADNEEANKEQKILMRAINDMNMPKFIQEDIFLFNALFTDLFPNTDLPESENARLYEAIENEMKFDKLIPKPEMIKKAIQLFDSKNTRHGNMLVGKSLSGKSTTWKILQRAMTALNKQQTQGDKSANATFPAVRVEILNPKTVTLNELFGFVDHATLEWNEGVLSSMMSRLCKEESNEQRWMILDGPVDTLWIESMNTVLDDNKVLTLLNGDRISLPQQVGLVFEVEDLSVASPATVSRAGMIYIDQNDLGWRPYIEAWISRMKDLDIQDFFLDLVDKWIMRLFKTRSLCKELVPCSDINIVIGLCRLMDSFIRMESTTIGLELPNKNEIYYALLEKWFTFALIWSFGATVDEDGRKLVDYHMRDIESIFPHSNTVYDYYINVDKNEWASWEDKINASVWKPGPNMPYHKMLVPTVDSARNRFVIHTLLKNKISTLIVGNTGTGKTAVINGILSELDESYTSMNIVFSSQTNSQKTQEMIESKLVRRTKYKMIPDGKKMVIFVDDLNMPRKDQFGSQPPLELFRQWMDYEGWFDRQARDIFKQVIDVQFIAAMGPPGGGRAQISRRTQGKFNVINFTFPTDAQVRRIFQSILNHKFQEFEEEIKPLAEPVAQATLNLFRSVSESFLPTPKKSHYVFNLRDISKVIQGVYLLDRFYCDSKLTIYRLWVHECLRVFHDRLISFDDRFQLKKLISDQLEQTLQSNMKECTNEDESDTIFIDFLEQSSGKPVYIEVSQKERPQLKAAVEAKLDDYNKKQRSPMPIVLFEEAISYVCKIHRIIKLGKGHGLLVGEGGSGRHSLTRLAAFIADYELWQIEISRNYRVKEFRDDIKKWAEEAGYKGKSGVFLFSDNQIVNEGFIEDINNILTVGEVPNLFSQKDDYPQIKEKMRKKFIEHNKLEKDARILDEDLIDFFFTRVQNNFHLMLCMSKTGDSLRNYTRMYPGLVNNTTIIWYMPWPEEALLEVANKYLKPLTLQDKIKEVPLKVEAPPVAAPVAAAPQPAYTQAQRDKDAKDPKKIAEEEARLAEERIEEERREGLRK